MEKSLTLNRINLSSGGFKSIVYIMWAFLLLITILLLFLGEYLGFLIPVIFGFFISLFIVISNSEKIVFSDSDIKEIHFGKVKKQILFSEIVEIMGCETGTSLIQLLSQVKNSDSENEEMNPIKGFGRGNFYRKMDAEKLKEISAKNGFKFLIISKTKVPAGVMPLSLTRNKGHIVMHYYPEALDWLTSKS